MYVEMFPFGAVPRNSRIVIYGFGNVGRQYFMQIKATDYAEVIAIADKNITKLSDMMLSEISSVNVLDLEDLFSLPAESYDYVIIAISDKEISLQAAEDMVFKGIEQRKIVHTLQPSFINDSSIHSLLGIIPPNKTIMHEPDEWSKFLNGLMVVDRNPWQYIDEIKNTVDDSIGDKNTFLDFFVGEFSSRLNFKARLLLLNLLYKQNCFDDSCMKIFMKSLLEMDWDDDTPYFCVNDADVMVFMRPEILYESYWEERKKLLRRICSYYNLTMPSTRFEHKSCSSKALFTFYWFHDKPVISRIALNYMRGFMARGWEVKAVILGTTDKVVREKLFLEPFVFRPHIANFKEIWSEHMQDIPAIYVDEWDVATRLQRGIDEICLFDPDVIVDFSDEFFPAAAVLIDRYPIVYMPARGMGTSAFFDYYISGDTSDMVEKGLVPYAKVKQVDLYNHYTEDEPVIYKRSFFGILENDFVIITVGTRLDRELRADFLRVICDLLDEESSIKWLIVGYDKKKRIEFSAFNRLCNEGKILIRRYEDHLESLYAICDAYLEPNRQGGATSIRRAMMVGLPVAMTDFPSDNLSRMKGHVVRGGYNELILYLKKLINDHSFCLSEGRAMQLLMKDALPQKDADKLLEICKDVIALKRKS